MGKDFIFMGSEYPDRFVSKCKFKCFITSKVQKLHFGESVLFCNILKPILLQYSMLKIQ